MSRNTPLRNRVKELRERLNVRQSELAREAGVTRQTIIAIEKGRLNPSIVISLKIAKLLREPVDYIFYLQPGYDYEQEARENANRPKRGRKKRVPVAASAEQPTATPPPAAVAFETKKPTLTSDEQRVTKPVEKPLPPPQAVQKDTPAKPVPKKPVVEKQLDPEVEKSEELKSGQAIWDFF